MPFFLIVAAPPIACLLRDAVAGASSIPRVSSFFRSMQEICAEFRTFERLPRIPLSSALAVFLVGMLFVSGRKGYEGEFDPDTFPGQAIPLIRSSSARRIFTYDQWSDYLIYRLYPSVQVFVDGRSDFYGDDLLLASQHIVEGRYDWSRQLSRFAVDMVIVKPESPLSTILKTASGWKLLFDDGKVLIFEMKSRRRESSISAGWSARALGVFA
jgi:hypothetical protein